MAIRRFPFQQPGDEPMPMPLPNTAQLPGDAVPDSQANANQEQDDASNGPSQPVAPPPPPPVNSVGPSSRITQMPPPAPPKSPKADARLKDVMPPPAALSPLQQDSGMMPPPPLPQSAPANPMPGMQAPASMPPPPPPTATQQAMDNYNSLAPPPPPGKPSIWQRLGAIGLGAAAGYANAGGRMPQPIDARAGIENILHPGYAQKRGIYEQQKQDALDQLDRSIKSDQVSSLGEQRKAKAEELEAQAKERETTEARKTQEDADKREAVLLGAQQKGWQQIPAGSPPPPGYVATTLYGKTFAAPTNETTEQSKYVPLDEKTAGKLGLTPGRYPHDVIKTMTDLAAIEAKADNKPEANPTEAALAARAAAGDKVADRALQRLDQSRLASRPVTNVNVAGNNSGLSEAAIDMYAHSVASGAPMPNVGYGKPGAAMRKEISNRAADILNGGNLAGNEADFKGQSASIRQSTMSANALKRSEDSLNGHLQMLQDASRDAARTGSPLVNHLVLWAKGKAVGDPATQKYLQMATEAKMEYAKILSGGVTSNAAITEGAMREADKLFSENFGAGSVDQAANTIRQVAAVKRGAFDKNLAEQRDQIRNIGAAPQPAQNKPEQKSTQNNNPNPNGYVKGHIYGGLTYLGGDPNNQASWKK